MLRSFRSWAPWEGGGGSTHTSGLLGVGGGVCVSVCVCFQGCSVCVCVCVCFQGRNVMISSGFKIAPVEFSVEMNTYRVVTQVIKREKKEL